MNINELTIGQIREIQSFCGAPTASNPSHLVVGEKYLIRTVTMHLIGRLKSVNDSEYLLSDACWLADSGLYGDCLADGSIKEAEVFPDDVIVGRGALVDATKWRHDLPRKSTR